MNLNDGGNLTKILTYFVHHSTVVFIRLLQCVFHLQASFSYLFDVIAQILQKILNLQLPVALDWGRSDRSGPFFDFCDIKTLTGEQNGALFAIVELFLDVFRYECEEGRFVLVILADVVFELMFGGGVGSVVGGVAILC